jgi:hypothetical protein
VFSNVGYNNLQLDLFALGNSNTFIPHKAHLGTICVGSQIMNMTDEFRETHIRITETKIVSTAFVSYKLC